MFLKKMMLIFLAVIIAFTGVYSIPQQKAQAFAIPAALQAGAGVYVIGGLLIAGGAGLVGYEEHGEEIKAHSLRAWNTATQLSKDSFDLSIEAATGVGNGVVNLYGDFINFIDSKLDSLSSSYAIIATERADVAGFEMIAETSSSIRWLRLQGGTHAFSTTTGHFSSSVGLTEYFGTLRVHIGRDVLIYSPSNTQNYSAISKWPRSTPTELMAIFDALGMGLSAGVSNVQDWQANKAYATPRIKEAWESMKDAGLVLPVDSFVPYGPSGTRLNYNPQTGEVTNAGGRVYNPGEYSWQVPNTRYRDKTDDIPQAGVWVDLPTYVPGELDVTGNPVRDIPNVTDVPQTITHINTGTTVGNPAYSTDVPGGGTPTNPPENPWNRPPGKKPPTLPALVVTKFPFSLPWDLFGLIGWLQAEPKAPVFKLDTSMNNPFGQDMRFKTDFTLEFLDDYIGFFRSFILIGFSLFLILSTRKLLGGGS